MKVARIYLRSLAKRPAHNDRRSWRNSLLSKDLADPSAHAERLRRLVDVAAASSVDVAIFPACSFMCDGSTAAMNRWRKLLARAAPLTIAGAFVPGEDIEDDDLWMEEVLCAFTDNESLLDPEGYGPSPLLVGEQPLIAAISSSISGVRDYPAVFAATAKQASSLHPLVIADVGHEPYGGRYAKLLGNVVTAMSAAGASPVHLIVSTWTWSGGSTGHWCFDADGSSQPPLVRTEIEAPGGTDIVDIITL